MHCHSRHFFSRHLGGRGLGRFGRGFMDSEGGAGGRGFGMGRKLAAADLQLLILRLLADKPRHGYEIIKDLDERSRGFYVPSPGMIYPALTYLEEIGHATIETEGNRKRYHITDSGRRYLDENRAAADSLMAQFERVAERMERVRRVLSATESGEELGGEPPRGGSKELMRARWNLKLALAGKTHASLEEQERVADILRRAAAEIIGTKPRG